jgi:multidrug efflux pump subunit AcrA (membrane-fusion protein)
MRNYFKKFAEDDPRVKKTILNAGIILTTFLGILFAWSYLAPLETAVLAPGKIVLKTNRKTIQHLEGGIVKKIFIHEGDYVNKGDSLIQLDDTIAKANFQSAFQEVNTLGAHMALLEARRDQLVRINFPKTLLNINDNVTKNIRAMQEAQFKTDIDTLNSQLNLYEQEIAQSNDQTAAQYLVKVCQVK